MARPCAPGPVGPVPQTGSPRSRKGRRPLAPSLALWDAVPARATRDRPDRTLLMHRRSIVHVLKVRGPQRQNQRRLPDDHLKQVVCAKPYLNSFMTETGVDAERNFRFCPDSNPEPDITLGVMQIPLRPAVEYPAGVDEGKKAGRWRYLPAIFRIHHNRVVAVEAEGTVAAQRIGAAKRRL